MHKNLSLIFMQLVMGSLRLLHACHDSQECYTPQNFKGYYYTAEEMEKLSERQKMKCAGYCQDKNVTLICCTIRTLQEKYRLLYTCE